MGTDTPLAVLSERPRLLYDYFKQLFAQVTNPPLDAIREELVTSMESTVGPERNLLQPRAGELPADQRHAIRSSTTSQLAKLRHIALRGFRVGHAADAVPRRRRRRRPGERRSTSCARRPATRSRAGYTILILSDRGVSEDLAPIPSLLATAAVHHHLVREGTRTRCGLVLETGDAREVHHVALLIGYGAGAVNPYLAFETLDDMIRQRDLLERSPTSAPSSTTSAALNKGILKVMSKMGISTLQSYCGAQIFEAIGLDQAFVDRYFTSTASRIGGVGLDVVADEVRRAPRARLPGPPRQHRRPRFRRRVPVAPRRRAPPVQPRDRVQAPARDPDRPVQHLSRLHHPGQRPEPQARHAARPARLQRPARRSRSTRSSRSRRSSSASPPARCRTARSARRRTRRSPSR